MKFIELHVHVTGKKVLVNVDKIACLIEPIDPDEGYIIDFGLEDFLIVTETLEEILKLIERVETCGSNTKNDK